MNVMNMIDDYLYNYLWCHFFIHSTKEWLQIIGSASEHFIGGKKIGHNYMYQNVIIMGTVYPLGPKVILKWLDPASLVNVATYQYCAYIKFKQHGLPLMGKFTPEFTHLNDSTTVIRVCCPWRLTCNQACDQEVQTGHCEKWHVVRDISIHALYAHFNFVVQV